MQCSVAFGCPVLCENTGVQGKQCWVDTDSIPGELPSDSEEEEEEEEEEDQTWRIVK